MINDKRTIWPPKAHCVLNYCLGGWVRTKTGKWSRGENAISRRWWNPIDAIFPSSQIKSWVSCGRREWKSVVWGQERSEKEQELRLKRRPHFSWTGFPWQPWGLHWDKEVLVIRVQLLTHHTQYSPCCQEVPRGKRWSEGKFMSRSSSDQWQAVATLQSEERPDAGASMFAITTTTIMLMLMSNITTTTTKHHIHTLTCPLQIQIWKYTNS